MKEIFQRFNKLMRKQEKEPVIRKTDPWTNYRGPQEVLERNKKILEARKKPEYQYLGGNPFGWSFTEIKAAGKSIGKNLNIFDSGTEIYDQDRVILLEGKQVERDLMKGAIVLFTPDDAQRAVQEGLVPQEWTDILSQTTDDPKQVIIQLSLR